MIGQGEIRVGHRPVSVLGIVRLVVMAPKVRTFAWGWLMVGLGAGPLCGDDGEDVPRRPDQPIAVFNGKDLGGLSHWLKDARRDDPRGVFGVTKEGWLRISGDGFGYVGSVKPHRDYRLLVEYRWGTRTDGGRSVRNSGILLNAVGPDGGVRKTWMPSVECQLAQGWVGDLIVIRNDPAEVPGATPVRFTGEVAIGPDGRPRWRAGGTARTFEAGQFWWSRHDPDFKELRDTRGKEDVEGPTGEWTRVECTVPGDRIGVRVNGVLVNECRDVAPAGGKLLLQTAGAELLVRTFELHPLP